jgi:hypothetical protein
MADYTFGKNDTATFKYKTALNQLSAARGFIEELHDAALEQPQPMPIHLSYQLCRGFC